MKHTHHTTHQNSRSCLVSISGEMTRREKEIYGLLSQASYPMTDREIKDALKYSDMNSVRPRITELIQKYWVKENGSTIDETTGKKVRRVVALSKSSRKTILDLQLNNQTDPEAHQLHLFMK